MSVTLPSSSQKHSATGMVHGLPFLFGAVGVEQAYDAVGAVGDDFVHGEAGGAGRVSKTRAMAASASGPDHLRERGARGAG